MIIHVCSIGSKRREITCGGGGVKMVIIPSLPSVMEKVGSRERREDRLSFFSDLYVDGQSKGGDMCMNYPLITCW